MKKKKKIFNIILSLLFGFQQFFFFPMEIYYSDKLSFALASKYFAIPMLILTLVVCGIVFVILWFSLKKSKKIHKYISLLLMGYILASYIQAMILNGKMGKITGEFVVDYDDVSFITYNLEIFLGLMILPLIICFIKNKYIVKLKKIVNWNVAIYLFSVLFFMQFMGYISNYIKFYNENKSLGNRIGCFSYEPSMHLSDKENIVVFLTDKLGGRVVDDLIKDYPELNEYFEGFTYYKDNCSYYCATYPSVVSLFSKTKLEDLNGKGSYINTVWRNQNLAGTLKQNEYDVYLHIDKGTTYNSFKEVNGVCDNAVSRELNKDTKIKYNSILKVMVEFSFSKTMPYIAKGFFVLYYNSDFANRFIEIDYGKYPDIQKQMVGPSTDLAFYNYLKENKLKADNDNKVFSFVHINGNHDPSKEEADLYEGKKADNLEYATARGECEILYEYIKQMKDLGIFDNSTIIILADHDDIYGPRLDFDGNIYEISSTALLVKEKNADIVPLKIDEESQMSNAYFYDSVLEYAGIKNENSGYTYRSVSNNYSGENITRIMKNMIGEVYEVNGNARDIKSYKKIK